MSYKIQSPLPVIEGGTGVQSNTVYAVLCGGTTITGPIQSIASVGTAGQVLTSNGAAALPTFQNSVADGITSITGDTGGAQTGPNITFAGGTTGLSFGGAANTITTTFAGITANGGTVSLATDATTSTVNIGTGAGFKTVTVGSATSTSITTLQSGSGPLNITTANGALTANAGTGTTNIATDVTTSSINIGTAGSKTITIGNTSGTTSLTLRSGGTGNVTIDSGSSGSAAVNITSNGTVSIQNTGTNTDINISTNTASNNVNIGTGNGDKDVTVGSLTETSSLILQSGTGNISITSVGIDGDGTITAISGTGAIAISNDAAATTIGIGTGAGAKTVTVGSTNTTSSLALRYGTADFTLASATGTTISALDTGEVTMPIQPAFFAYVLNTITNVTGDGTFYGIIFDTEVYDQGSDFNLGTSTFSAPVTGRYHFAVGVGYLELGVLFTDGRVAVSTSNRDYQIDRSNYGAIQTSGILITGNNVYADMDAGDTAVVTVFVAGSTLTVDIFGDTNAITFFSGVLVV